MLWESFQQEITADYNANVLRNTNALLIKSKWVQKKEKKREEDDL